MDMNMQNMQAIDDLHQLPESVCVCVCEVITDTAHFRNNDVHFCLTIGTPIVEAYCFVRQTIPGFNEFVQNCF